MKSSNGCWTCRLRRKKCDEERPICATCAALHITCHYNQDKPEWMDGGSLQEDMAQQLKREVKDNAHHRRLHHITRHSNARASVPGGSAGESSRNAAPVASNISGDDGSPLSQMTNLQLRDAQESTPRSESTQWSATLGWSDTIYLSFYIEHVFPFLFPFHNPCPLQGGQAWIVRLISSSPVVRQAMLCQSSYFLSLSQGARSGDSLWESVLEQTREAFEVLRQALQVIQGSDITHHLRGTVRILASIVQVLRFEITVLSFDNIQAHLNAAIALFNQLLHTPGTPDPALSFQLLMSLLKPLSETLLPEHCGGIPSAEQTAFRFTCSLLLLDDIIASTALQERPVLYDYHRSLLLPNDGVDPVINIEDVLGCQNWVLQHIGEIAVLDAWIQQEKRAGRFNDSMILEGATSIRSSLESNLAYVEANPDPPQRMVNGLLNVLSHYPHDDCSVGHNPWLTRIWAHAALIYLSVVESDLQAARSDAKYHVERIIEILTHRITPRELLRTTVWPFCVAGCLAAQAQETQFRHLVDALQPASVFGTVRQALTIMEKVWEDRDRESPVFNDLAACFRSQGELVLLV